MKDRKQPRGIPVPGTFQPFGHGGKRKTNPLGRFRLLDVDEDGGFFHVDTSRFDDDRVHLRAPAIVDDVPALPEGEAPRFFSSFFFFLTGDVPVPFVLFVCLFFNFIYRSRSVDPSGGPPAPVRVLIGGRVFGTFVLGPTHLHPPPTTHSASQPLNPSGEGGGIDDRN